MELIESDDTFGCWDPKAEHSSERVGNFTFWVPLEVADYSTEGECVAAGHRWVDQVINFNNVLESMIACFVLTTGEGWVELMHSSMDIGARKPSDTLSKTKNIEIQQDSNPSYAIFFVVFLHVFSFFIIDLYAGAVYSYYQKVKAKEEGITNLTTWQQQW